MASFKALLMAGVTSLVVTTSAYAADLPLPPPPVVEPPPLVIGGGWYLRGDVGASFNEVHDLNASFYDPTGVYRPNGGYPGGFAYNGASVETGTFVGGGVGYQYNAYLRGDVTGEYRFGGKYDNIESYGVSGGCTALGGRCSDDYSSRLTSVLVLANGYIDIGTWYGITPFVGAGVGAAFNTFGVLIDRGVQTTGYGSSYASRSQANFAYAFMAGLDYAIGPNVKVEAGYRYVNLGAFQSAGITCNASPGSPCVSESQRLKLEAQEVRVGLRYTFADVVPAVPVIAKY